MPINDWILYGGGISLGLFTVYKGYRLGQALSYKPPSFDQLVQELYELPSDTTKILLIHGAGVQTEDGKHLPGPEAIQRIKAAMHLYREFPNSVLVAVGGVGKPTEARVIGDYVKEHYSVDPVVVERGYEMSENLESSLNHFREKYAGQLYVVSLTSPGREKRVMANANLYACEEETVVALPFSVVNSAVGIDADVSEYYENLGRKTSVRMYELLFILPVVLFGKIGATLNRKLAHWKREKLKTNF